LPERKAALRAFDRASAGFGSGCVVHDEVRRRLLERLDWMRIDPAVIVDVGCATGLAARALAARYPAARVVGVDPSRGMLRAARAECDAARIAIVGGAAEALPLRDRSVGLAFASSSLPWSDPQAAFAELARVLEDGGLAVFATLGPDTLIEVRRAWRTVDDAVHVHAFVDMHDLGDLAIRAGLAEPVLDVDRLTLSYRDVAAFVRDMRAWGAVNAAAGRRKTLTGPGRWRRFAAALGCPFDVPVELGLGHAGGTGRACPTPLHAVSST